jgi:hypothetical protein
MAVGCKKWCNEDSYASIRIDNLRPEILLDDNAVHPFVGIWAGKPNKPAMDVSGIKKVFSAADKVLTKDELAICEKAADPSDYRYVLRYKLPEDRRDLVGMLLEGDGQRFVDCLVAHFEVFAKFIPVLDEVFSKPGKK